MRGTKTILEVKWKDKWYYVHEEYDRVYLVSEFIERGVQMFSIVKTEVQETEKEKIK